MSYQTTKIAESNNHRETYIEWLDRQYKGESGYPFWMGQVAINWLQDRVKEFLIQSISKGHKPEIGDVVAYWKHRRDLPYDLFFLFHDGLYGVTYKALIDVYPQILFTLSALNNVCGHCDISANFTNCGNRRENHARVN